MKSRYVSFSRRLVAVLTSAFLPGAASAAVSDWIAVPEASLDHMRGGFSSPVALQVSLGLARLVAVNGEVLARSELAFDGIDGLRTRSTPAQARLQGSSMVVQIGSANAASSPFTTIGTHGAFDTGMARTGELHAAAAGSPGSASGFILQNSLSGQQINSLTTIHASVNSGALLDAINFHGQLSDALARAAAAQ